MSLDDPAEAVGVVVLSKLARIPRVGDKTDLQTGVAVEVIGTSRRRVTAVRVRTANPTASSPDAVA